MKNVSILEWLSGPKSLRSTVDLEELLNSQVWPKEVDDLISAEIRRRKAEEDLERAKRLKTLLPRLKSIVGALALVMAVSACGTLNRGAKMERERQAARHAAMMKARTEAIQENAPYEAVAAAWGTPSYASLDPNTGLRTLVYDDMGDTPVELHFRDGKLVGYNFDRTTGESRKQARRQVEAQERIARRAAWDNYFIQQSRPSPSTTCYTSRSVAGMVETRCN